MGRLQGDITVPPEQSPLSHYVDLALLSPQNPPAPDSGTYLPHNNSGSDPEAESKLRDRAFFSVRCTHHAPGEGTEAHKSKGCFDTGEGSACERAGLQLGGHGEEQGGPWRLEQT